MITSTFLPQASHAVITVIAPPVLLIMPTLQEEAIVNEPVYRVGVIAAIMKVENIRATLVGINRYFTYNG